MQEYKNGTMFLVLSAVFVLLSLFFGTGFVISSVSSNNAQKALTEEINTRTDLECIKGKVTQITEEGNTIVNYKIGYEVFDLEVEHKMSAYGEGTEVDVYYQPDEPANAIAPEIEVTALKYYSKLFGRIGAVVFALFLIPAAVLCGVGLNYRKKGKKILAERTYY